MQKKQLDKRLISQILQYASYVVRRGWVCNTLGTIAVRAHNTNTLQDVIYTKRRGISLEEMQAEDIAVTDMDGALLHGKTPPSIGHQLNREVFRHRNDINAVIHLHVDEVIALFGVKCWERMPFISDDAALVLEKPVIGLERQINVEKDASMVKDFIHDTNCFVMHNHGITTLGKDVSQAYHRLCTCVAEVRRIILAMQISRSAGVPVPLVPYLSKNEEEEMFRIGSELIYGDK